MKKFEIGKTYRIDSDGLLQITVTKKTDYYIWFTGYHAGKKLICKDGLFKWEEYFLLETGNRHLKYFVHAGKEIE